MLFVDTRLVSTGYVYTVAMCNLGGWGYHAFCMGAGNRIILCIKYSVWYW